MAFVNTYNGVGWAISHTEIGKKLVRRVEDNYINLVREFKMITNTDVELWIRGHMIRIFLYSASLKSQPASSTGYPMDLDIILHRYENNPHVSHHDGGAGMEILGSHPAPRVGRFIWDAAR